VTEIPDSDCVDFGFFFGIFNFLLFREIPWTSVDLSLLLPVLDILRAVNEERVKSEFGWESSKCAARYLDAKHIYPTEAEIRRPSLRVAHPFSEIDSAAMGKSSKDKRDIYYRLAKEQNWRARSAFKLIQLDEQFDLFSYEKPENCTRVVDLCAAPGSWSQVLSRVLIKGESFGRRAWIEKQAKLFSNQESTALDGLEKLSVSDGSESQQPDQEPVPITSRSETALKPRGSVKIVAIDLQPMASLEGIVTLKADITNPSTVPLLLKALDPEYEDGPMTETHRVDLVISDGAPDVTGLHDLDIYVQSQLLHSALTLAMKVLRPGGKFVAKIFRGRNVDLIYAQLKLVFTRVHVAKPRSSRASSIEAFVVCEGFKPIAGWTPDIGASIKTQTPGSSGAGGPQRRHVRKDGITELEMDTDYDYAERFIAPFLACGDLSAWDADASYKLPEGHVSLDPVQPPTAPPYKAALEKRRMDGGAYGKTTKDKKNTTQSGKT
jgi:tRNA (cytidine32/guanosine34-2'-O)-methyltransferase